MDDNNTIKRWDSEAGEWREDDGRAWRYDERRDRFEFLTEKQLERRRLWRTVLFFLVTGCTASGLMVITRLSS